MKSFKQYLNESNKKYSIELAGSKGTPYYVLVSKQGNVVDQIDMMFDTEDDARKYAKKNGIKLG